MEEDRYEVRRVLVQMSKEILNKQIESYNSLQKKAQIAIGATSIFFTTFLAFIKDTNQIIKIASLLPLVLIIVGMYLAIYVIHPRGISTGIKVNEIENLLNLDLKSLQLKKIALYKRCVELNMSLLKRISTNYRNSMTCIALAVLFSIILFYVNIIIK